MKRRDISGKKEERRNNYEEKGRVWPGISEGCLGERLEHWRRKKKESLSIKKKRIVIWRGGGRSGLDKVGKKEKVASRIRDLSREKAGNLLGAPGGGRERR
jgi:hypothetical protein